MRALERWLVVQARSVDVHSCVQVAGLLEDAVDWVQDATLRVEDNSRSLLDKNSELGVQDASEYATTVDQAIDRKV